MLKDIILGIASGLTSCLITLAFNEWRFRTRQKERRIKEIVESFLKLRQETKNNQVYELRYLQSSGILLLKKEQDAEEVLRQVELRDKPVIIPKSIREKGVLQGLRMAIKDGINIEDFREVELREIAEIIKER